MKLNYKKVGEKSNLINRRASIIASEHNSAELMEYVRGNCSVEIVLTNVVNIKVKLTFNAVQPDIKQVIIATYFFGDNGKTIVEPSNMRYLDLNDNEIILKKLYPGYSTVNVTAIGFACKNADLNFDVEVFDTSKEAAEEGGGFF